MSINEIFDKLDSGKYFIEHTVQESNGEILIIGHVSDKQNPSGFGRYEFAIRNLDEQNQFIERYTEYFKKIIG